MKKIITTVIALAAVVGAYLAVKEIGKLFDEENSDFFAEDIDLD